METRRLRRYHAVSKALSEGIPHSVSQIAPPNVGQASRFFGKKGIKEADDAT